MALPESPFPTDDPAPLVVQESHGDEILFYLLQAREAVIDMLGTPEGIDDVEVANIDPDLQMMYRSLLSSINLRKKTIGIDSLEE